MKNTMNYLLSASVLALTFVANTATPVNAQTCVNAPTCAELGYTLTSTTTCAGTPLKCPFDKTKYYCTTKAEVANYSSPDYSKVKNFSSNSTYTATSAGCIFGRTSDIERVGSYIKINGQYPISGESIHPSWQIYFFCLSKGDTYYVQSGDSSNYFVPLKGSN